jgi:ppGpp synthetase/RelA/SpoT-type nucleotidyltranferase
MDERVVERFVADYAARHKAYDDFADRVKALIDDLLSENNIDVHSVTARAKGLEQLREKLQRPESSYELLEDVTDLAGVRIITHLSDDVDRAGKIIEQEFSIDRANSIDKRASLDPDRFGYLSLHYVASLSKSRAKLTEYRRYPELKVEIQIRSILQHAWAEIEHDLGYKAKTDVPRQIRRRFSRIAGLLELADQEFVGIRDELARYEREVPNKIKTRPKSVLLDKLSLAAFVANDPNVGKLDVQIAQLYKRPLADLMPPEGEAARLRGLNLETIDDVRQALIANSDELLRFAAHWIKPAKSQGPVRKGICLVFLRYVLVGKSANRELAHQVIAHSQPGGTKESFIDRIFQAYLEFNSNAMR